MQERAAQDRSEISDEVRAGRLSFLRSETALGAVRRCAASARKAAPMLIEEASWYAEQRWKLTGVAVAGELLGEGLWTYQMRKRDEQLREHTL